MPVRTSLKDRLLSRPFLCVLVIFILAAALRTVLLVHYRMIDTDSAYYGNIARLFASGHWVKACDPYWPPLYPFLASLPYESGLSLEAAGIIISLLASSGCVIVCFLLARIVASTSAGFLAAGLAAIHPRLIGISQSFLTEPLYAFFICGGLALFGLAFKSAEHRSFLKNSLLFFASGVLLALSFLTRHEGALYFLLLLIFSIAGLLLKPVFSKMAPLKSRPKNRHALLPLFLLAGFVSVSLVYIYQVTRLEGRLTLGEKAEANFYIAYKSEYEKAGISVEHSDYDSITGPEHPRRPGNYRVFEFIRKRPEKIIRQTLRNLPKALLDKIPSLMTWPFIALSLVGLIFRRRIRRVPFEKLLVLWILVAVFIYSPLFLFRRFFIATVPVFLVWGAVGLEELRHRMKRRLFLILLSLWSVFSVLSANFSLSSQSWPILYKEAGLWLKAQGIKPLVLAGRKPETSFYAEAEFRPLKGQAVEELKNFFIQESATHLIVEDYILPSSHPGLVDLLDPAKAPVWLNPIHSAARDGHRLIIYEYSPDRTLSENSPQKWRGNH
ncbi:MAG: hypothetical protein WCC06_05155 [Candidatus Aminicenantales bacterium]